MKNEKSRIYRIANDNIDIIVVIWVLFIGFLVFWRLFRPGLPAYEDNPPHFIEAWSLVNYIIPNNLGSSAWVNYDFAGFPIFMYHPYPLGFYVIYLLQLIPGISLEIAYKLIMFLSYVLPAICLYFVMRKKVGVDYALIPACLWMLNLYALDLVVQGMWSISLSMAPFILLLNELYILLDEKEEINYFFSILKISLMLSGILLLHAYTFLVSLMIIGLLGLFLLVSIFRSENNIKSKSILRGDQNSKIFISLSGSIILTFIIDWFYIKNILKSSNWLISTFDGGTSGHLFHVLFPYGLGLRSIYTFFLQYDYVSALIVFLNKLFVNLPNLFLLSIGILGIWYNKNKLFNKVNVIVVLILLSGISGLFNFLNNLPIIKYLIMHRFSIYIQTIILFYVSIGFFHFIQNRPKIKTLYEIEKNFLHSKKSFFPKILIGIVFVLFVTNEGYALFEAEEKMYVMEDYQDFEDISKVFNWIENNINESTRVYYQSTWDASRNSGIDRSWVMAYANYYTSKPSLGSWSGLMPYPSYRNLQTYDEYGEVIFGGRVENFTDENVSSILKVYNSKYIVVHSKSMRNLLNNSLLFNENFSSGRFSIYSINNYVPSYIQTRENNSLISNIRIDKELIEFDTFNTESVNLSFQYHQYWKAYSNGKPLTIEKNDFNLMTLKISGNINKSLPVSLIFEK